MTLFSVGHSTCDWPTFESMLERHEIGLVVDVRSYPRSRLPHFSRPQMRPRLNHVGIGYLHLGDDLGGYSSTGADYAMVARSTAFLRGVDRLLDLSSRTRLAMVCAEAEPLECHRCLLIGRHLAGLGKNVEHIHRDGSCETHAEAEDRLLDALGRTESDLLASREERLAEAYRKQELRVLRGLKLPVPRHTTARR